jgi:Rod binding domain-containing protein
MESIGLNSGINFRPETTRQCGSEGNRPADERKKKVARNFEGVLIGKVMEEMKNSVPESGLLEDETSNQMQGLFWMYLAQDVSDKGGFGLWKQIYEQINEMPGRSASLGTADKII